MVIFVISSIHLAGYLHNLFKQIFDIWVGNRFISSENGMWRLVSQDYKILCPKVLEKQLVEHLNSQKSESVAKNNKTFGLLREYLSVLCGLCFQIQLRKLYHAQIHTHAHTHTLTHVKDKCPWPMLVSHDRMSSGWDKIQYQNGSKYWLHIYWLFIWKTITCWWRLETLPISSQK